MIDNAFGTVLRRLRHEKELSQEDFAREIGLHRTYVSQLERGLKSPSLRTFHRIATALGIRLDSFMALIEDQMARVENE